VRVYCKTIPIGLDQTNGVTVTWI